MRIAIINITGGGMSEGYHKYIKSVIPLLVRHHEVEALLCAAPDSWRIQEWFYPIKNVKFVKCPTFKLFCQYDAELTKQLDSFCPDVLFVPVERYFRYKNVPVINMLQNMEPFLNLTKKNSLFLNIESKIQYFISKTAIINSDRVIAISNFVRDFLINKWYVPAEKVALIYHGIQRDQNSYVLKPEAIPQDISKDFLFTAGSIRPARGLEDLILAAKSINFDYLGIKGIVIAGKTVPDMLKYKQRLLNLIKANNLSAWFIFLEEINPSQMEWCYENCRVFVMTSRVESFGMVGLEAMANGCLCIAADNPCLPEIFRDCAVYYKPKDAISLANAINSTLRWEEGKKVQMSRKARELAAEFSWDKTVNGLIKEFKVAIESVRLKRK